MQVLRLLALGMTNRQIGEALGITEKTARTHVGRIRRIMKARTRGEAVARAREMGLLDLAKFLRDTQLAY
jgi:DNA-binding CsgD family transcriptional regulator